MELPSSAASQQNSRTSSTLSTLSRDSGYESIVRAVDESPDCLVENHVGHRGDAGYSAFTFEDYPAAGDQITLVADNDQEAAAATMVTGTTAAPSVIFGRPKGGTQS